MSREFWSLNCRTVKVNGRVEPPLCLMFPKKWRLQKARGAFLFPLNTTMAEILRQLSILKMRPQKYRVFNPFKEPLQNAEKGLAALANPLIYLVAGRGFEPLTFGL